MFNRVRGTNGVGTSLAVAALCAFTLTQSSAEQLPGSSPASFQIDSFFMQYVIPDGSIDFRTTEVTPDPDTEYFMGGFR